MKNEKSCLKPGNIHKKTKVNWRKTCKTWIKTSNKPLENQRKNLRNQQNFEKTGKYC